MQGMSMLAWSFAALSHPPPTPLLDGIAAAMQRDPQAFGYQALANTMSSFAKLGYAPSAELCADVEAAYNPTKRPSQEATSLLWAFSKMRYLPSSLLEALQARAVESQEEGRQLAADDWARLLLVLARLGVQPRPGLLQALEDFEAAGRLASIKPLERCNLLWC